MAIFHSGADTRTGGLDSTDLWLPVFTGEVLTNFMDTLMLSGMVTSRSPIRGIEGRFSVLGAIGSEEHQPGALIMGTTVEHAQRSLYADRRPLMCATTYDPVDDLTNQIDVRSQLAAEHGYELARQQERRVAKVIIKTARTAAISGTSFPGGGIDGTGFGTGTIVDTNFDDADPMVCGAAVLKAIDRWVVRRDTQQHPEGPTYCVIPPTQWHALRNFNNVVYVAANISATVAAQATGLVPFAMAPLTSATSRKDKLVYKGVEIYQSNFLPNGTNTTTTEDTNTYGADYTNTFGAIWSPASVGFVIQRSMKVETWREANRQLDMVATSLMTGGGALRPELACELATA